MIGYVFSNYHFPKMDYNGPGVEAGTSARSHWLLYFKK